MYPPLSHSEKEDRLAVVNARRDGRGEQRFGFAIRSSRPFKMASGRRARWPTGAAVRPQRLLLLLLPRLLLLDAAVAGAAAAA